MGAPGLIGAQGLPGADGADGTAGADGASGADGVNGADGADGPIGPRGLMGLQGVPGATGAAGSQGAPARASEPRPDELDRAALAGQAIVDLVHHADAAVAQLAADDVAVLREGRGWLPAGLHPRPPVRTGEP